MRITSKRTAPETCTDDSAPKRPRLDPSRSPSQQQEGMTTILADWQNCTKQSKEFLNSLKKELGEKSYSLLCSEATINASTIQSSVDLISCLFKEQQGRIKDILKDEALIQAFYNANPQHSQTAESFITVEKWIEDYNLILFCTNIRLVKALAVDALLGIITNKNFDIQTVAKNIKARPLGDAPSSIISLENYGLTSLPEKIYDFSNTKKLCLRGNHISWIEDISSLPSLKFLDLSNNKINPHLKLPHSRCPSHIKVLKLNNNNLLQIPEFVFQLQVLQELDISENKIEQFPLELFQLEHLRCLTISSDQIEFLPAEEHRGKVEIHVVDSAEIQTFNNFKYFPSESLFIREADVNEEIDEEKINLSDSLAEAEEIDADIDADEESQELTQDYPNSDSNEAIL